MTFEWIVVSPLLIELRGLKWTDYAGTREILIWLERRPDYALRGNFG